MRHLLLSQKKCEIAVESLSSVGLLLSSRDKARVHQFFEIAIQRLHEEDRETRQVIPVREHLKKRIAAHHAGLLPLIREGTEMLFFRGLLRLLFATETLLQG